MANDPKLTIALLPKSQTNQRPGIAMMPAYGTTHETGNPNAGANARMHLRFLQSGSPDGNGQPTQTSYHFVIDDVEIIQMIPLDEVAWHAGDSGGPGNMRSIAAEHCVNRDGDFAKTLANGQWLWAEIQRNPGRFAWNGTPPKSLPLTVVQHNRWSGKNCPQRIREGGLWPAYLAGVTAQLAGKAAQTTPAVAYAKPVAPKPVQVGDLRGLTRVVTAGTSGANRRVAPKTDAAATGPTIEPGDRFVAVAYVEGDKPDGENGRWWVGDSGSFVWSGGTVEVPA